MRRLSQRGQAGDRPEQALRPDVAAAAQPAIDLGIALTVSSIGSGAKLLEIRDRRSPCVTTVVTTAAADAGQTEQ